MIISSATGGWKTAQPDALRAFSWQRRLHLDATNSLLPGRHMSIELLNSSKTRWVFNEFNIQWWLIDAPSSKMIHPQRFCLSNVPEILRSESTLSATSKWLTHWLYTVKFTWIRIPRSFAAQRSRQIASVQGQRSSLNPNHRACKQASTSLLGLASQFGSIRTDA